MYLSLGTLATSNPGIQAIDSWARYLGLGTLATSNPGIQAIGSWARCHGKSVATGNLGLQGQLLRGQVRTPEAQALFGEKTQIHLRNPIVEALRPMPPIRYAQFGFKSLKSLSPHE